MGYYAYLNPDCSFGGYADVRTLSSPSHGTAAIVQGKGYTAYAANNQRYECNKQESRMIEVVYTAISGYRGSDSFVLYVVYPNGTTVTNRYAITVE